MKSLCWILYQAIKRERRGIRDLLRVTLEFLIFRRNLVTEGIKRSIFDVSWYVNDSLREREILKIPGFLQGYTSSAPKNPALAGFSVFSCKISTLAGFGCGKPIKSDKNLIHNLYERVEVVESCLDFCMTIFGFVPRNSENLWHWKTCIDGGKIWAGQKKNFRNP